MARAERQWAAGLFVGLFGLIFLSVAIFGSGRALVDKLMEGRHLDRYIQTQAQVQSARMVRGSKGSSTLVVDYQYTHQGQLHRGNRIAPFLMMSSASTEEWLEQLQAAQRSDLPVPVWLDPQHPERSLLDKRFSPLTIVLLGGASVLFGLIGLGALWLASTLFRTSPQDKTAVTRPRPARRINLEGTWQGAALLGTFTLLWCSLSVPAAMVVLSAPENRHGLGLVVLVFPLFGVAMVWGTLQAVRQAWRNTTPLATTPKVHQHTMLPPGQISATGVDWRRIRITVGLLVLGWLAWHDGPRLWRQWQSGHLFEAAAPQPVTPMSLPMADRMLIEAANSGDLPALQRALDQAVRIDASDESGESALMQAAALGHLEVVKALLDKGAALEFTNQMHPHQKGDTALLRAAYRGHADVFLYLLQAGANVQVRNQWGWTPVHMAAMGNCLPCLEALQGKDLSLQESALPSRGETPLMAAAGRGGIPAMQWLLDHGADPLKKDNHGYDALGWARFFKRQDNEQWLLTKVPSLNETRPAPSSPGH